jgi:hypothetical protein
VRVIPLRPGATQDTPRRIQRRRARGWHLPPNTVYVGRPTRWGNPFDFRRSDYCWAALSFGCRGDRAGRQEAAVRAFLEWIDPPFGRRTLQSELQPKFAAGSREVAIGPAVEAGAAPSKDEIRAALRGRNLACFCPLDRPCHADVLLDIANRAEAA